MLLRGYQEAAFETAQRLPEAAQRLPIHSKFQCISQQQQKEFILINKQKILQTQEAAPSSRAGAA
jgi:hypothetical protein